MQRHFLQSKGRMVRVGKYVSTLYSSLMYFVTYWYMKLFCWWNFCSICIVFTQLTYWYKWHDCVICKAESITSVFNWTLNSILVPVGENVAAIAFLIKLNTSCIWLPIFHYLVLIDKVVFYQLTLQQNSSCWDSLGTFSNYQDLLFILNLF